MAKKDFKILLVDDDTALLKVLSNGLEKANYNVVSCPNPAEALSRVRHMDFNLVILDCVLPKMNGVDLAQNIRSFLPNAAVVFISGIFKDKNFINETLKDTQARHFLVKPFAINDLFAIIDTYIQTSANFRAEHWFDFWKKTDNEALLKRLAAAKSISGQELPLIVSLILNNELDGCLKVKIPEAEAQIFFKKGRIIKLTSTDPSSFFGALLIQKGLVTAEEIEEHLNTNQPEPIGERLVKAQLLSPHAIEQTLNQQTLLRLSRLVTSLPTVVEWQATSVEQDSSVQNKGTQLSELVEYFFNWSQSKIKIGWLRSQYVPWLDECPRVSTKSNANIPEAAKALLKKCDGGISLGELLQSFDNADQALILFNGLLLSNKITWGLRKTHSTEIEQIRHRLESLENNFKNADHFTVLGVNQNAKEREIKRAYLDLSKSLHPDQLPPDAPSELKSLSSRVFTYVTEAHDTLGDIGSRESYVKDLKLRNLRHQESGQQSMHRALQCLERKSYREAFELFSQLKKSNWHAQYLDLYYLWADLKRRSSLNAEDAKTFEQKLSELAPEDKHCYLFYYVKGLLALQRNLPEEAKSCFQNSLVLNAQFKPASFELQTLGGAVKSKSNPIFNSSSSKKKSA